MTQKKDEIFNDDTLMGFFLADGFVSISLSQLLDKKGGHRFTFFVGFRFEQFKANSDIFKKIDDFLYERTMEERANGNPWFEGFEPERYNGVNMEKLLANGGTLVIGWDTCHGRYLQQLLLNADAVLPRVYRDFQIAKYIKKLQSDRTSRFWSDEEKVLIVEATYQTSSQITDNTVNKRLPKEEVYRKTGISPQEVDKYAQIFKDNVLPSIEQQEKDARDRLSSVEISKGLIQGFHIGDGSLEVSYCVRPKRPIQAGFKWTLTDPDPDWLLALGKPLGLDRTNLQRSNNVWQLRIQSSVTIVEKIFPVLEDAWLSKSRKLAFLTLKKAMDVYEIRTSSGQRYIYTKKGWREFVKLTYNLNLYGIKRKLSMQEVIDIGEKQFS